MSKIKLIFVISNINIGGPQKSLLALLDNFNYNIFDVSVSVLEPGGSLERYYNKNIKFKMVDELITAATLPSSNTFFHLMKFIKRRKFKMFVGAIFALINHLVFNKNMNQERQKFWDKYKKDLPKLEEEYDLAFGILGLSTYYIVDCVRATKKFHWIRSDVRILNRNVKIDGEYYKKVDGALSVSSQCSDIFIDVYPFMKNKVDVFYNHIPVSFYKTLKYDDNHMKSVEDEIKLLTVTRLDPLKGIELAIEACKLLMEKDYKFKWFVLGDGKYRAQIEAMIKCKGIEKVFILLGFQLNTLSYINDADIFVHPSRTEGKSNAVDEAKFSGKPIVVTNYDTVGEQIEDNVTGLISHMSGEAIAQAIEKLILSESLRNKLSVNCKNQNDENKDPTEYFKSLRGGEYQNAIKNF